MNFRDLAGDCICETARGNINLIATAVLSYSSTLVNKNLAADFTLNSCLHKINKEKWRMYLLDKNNLS